MQKEEADKILIILLPHTLPDPLFNENLPYAVMIKFRYTHLADAAMLGSGGFDNIACCAFIILFVKNSIVGSLVLLNIGVCRWFLYLPWRY